MKKALLLIPVGLLFLSFRNKAAAGTSFNYVKRDCDAGGCGHFGASRGDRIHQAQDYLVTAGQTIQWPFAGVIERYVDPYGDGQYSGVQIKDTARGLEFKVMYMQPTVAVGQSITAGDTLGFAQDISNKYSSVPPHLHIETRLNGVLVDTAMYV